MRKVFTQDVLDASDNLTTDIAVASTAVIYTKSFKLSFADYFAISYIASSTGTPALKIELEQSFQEPTTEGSSDANWVEPENMADIETALATKTMHHKSLAPVTLAYARFKITGGASNPSDTTIAIKVSQQEEL